MRETQVFAYAFAAEPFDPWPQADGHWVCQIEVLPHSVEPLGDLLSRHADAGIELRITPSLSALREAIPGTGLRFSMVRMRNSQEG